MKLHEIIQSNDHENCESSILIEKILLYKKLLRAYYTAEFLDEPALMVVSVSNAAQYGIIVPIAEFNECLSTYLDAAGITDEEERQAAEETIFFNSTTLAKL